MPKESGFNKRLGEALGNALAGYRDGDTTRCGVGLADAVSVLRGAEAAVLDLEARNAALQARVDELERDAGRLEAQDDALHQLREWARAYPLKIFPEPKWEKAAKVLQKAGMTIDAISASNMRHVITQVIRIVDTALARASLPSTKEGKG